MVEFQNQYNPILDGLECMIQCANYKVNYKKKKTKPKLMKLMTNYLVICTACKYTVTKHVQMGRDFKQ